MRAHESTYLIRKLRWAVGLLLLLFSSGCYGGGLNAVALGLKEGDVIFQTSRSAQSQAIQLATHSRWSHMGILVWERNGWMVLEAVQPVKFTPLNDWVKRGQGGHVVVKRLLEADRKLDAEALVRMRKVAKRFLGKPYDSTFEWDDQRIYCSELVWKIYKEGAGIELGRLQRLKEFDLSNAVVQKKMRERYGNKVPLEEPVISPQAIFECPLLAKVAER